MLIRKPNDIPSSEITPESAYQDRRTFLREAGLLAAGAAAIPAAARGALVSGSARGTGTGAGMGPQEVPSLQSLTFTMGEDLQDEVNSYKDITTYNNFYEFGTGKGDPSRNAHTLRPEPWTVVVSGEVQKPRVWGMEDILRQFTLEDRIYRFRCVEAWSAVIPWRGFPLWDLIAPSEPTGNAKYVEFQTLYDPEQMPGQNRPVLPWPYVEGLRLDEAKHPLTLLVTGLYGRDVPNQNGAPLRLIVPWKYGFKGIKSIISIRLTEEQPKNTWNVVAPHEYGFYANVNPNVDHPRWSQARERKLGKLLPQPTLMFNGYGDQVAQLYAGMDLTKYY